MKRCLALLLLCVGLLLARPARADTPPRWVFDVDQSHTFDLGIVGLAASTILEAAILGRCPDDEALPVEGEGRTKAVVRPGVRGLYEVALVPVGALPREHVDGT